LLVVLGAKLSAQAPDAAFFEAKIRPVLATKCYGCHSSSMKAPMGGLALDTKAGLLAGGASGPVVIPGKPDESRLIKALSYTDPELQMPPTGKLPEAVRADFDQWISAGASDPRTAGPKETSQSPKPLRGMSVEDGKKWWAFQPVREFPAPKVRNARWEKDKIDAFILANLERKRLKPSPAADARTLAIRAYIDLVGYRPTYQEIEAFVSDKSPDAWEKLVDRLLASPRYGERWGRHWMDVARFGEDNPTAEATNPSYLYAWRYRDWIIEAINKDVPYDRFVKLQLAADLMPGTPREDLRALGYLGAAPIYHKDLRLSKDVIGGFMTDDWDERVDAVSRGLLAMTVACARCHDHKFDPIPTKDYYGLVGVFASTMRAERPLFDVDPKVEARYLWVQKRLFDLHYSADLLTGEASTVEGSEARVAKWKAEIEVLKAEMLQLQDQYPQLVKSMEKNWTFTPRRPPMPAAPVADGAPKPPVAEVPPPRRQRNLTSTEPFMNTVYDAAQYVDGSDEHFTVINYKAAEARDFPVLLHGNVATPGDVVPRHFPTVLAKGDSTFKNGSGRLELGEKIFSDSAPLAARVIVNRVWGWHFGRALVITPSDFGVQGEKPSNSELLDDLSARFIAHGWSLKWLNREIMLSATYRQSSRPRADGDRLDQLNSLYWRMNPKRMDIESYRDTLLRAAGRLDEKMYGPSEDIENEAMIRRTVYGRVSRGRLSNLLKNYDFPDPMQTAGTRDLTTTSLQQLFVMNSAFMHAESSALVDSVEEETDNSAKLRTLYRKILSRDPSPQELDLGLTYLANGTLDQYAQVLLSTNEEIFWP
jgi:Protein of unknown function (DUF1549)/Protein of unknown function (DUF1553)/Planctomycete cytochrome C